MLFYIDFNIPVHNSADILLVLSDFFFWREPDGSQEKALRKCYIIICKKLNYLNFEIHHEIETVAVKTCAEFQITS